jgi:hypothetical protein
MWREGIMIELTPEQQQAVEQGGAVRVIDPATHQAYVIVRAEVYERRADTPPPREDATAEVSPHFRRSQQAFWRDLPELLKGRRNRGKWVAYHGDERIGTAAQAEELIRACARRGFGERDYYLDVIEPMEQPPWLHVEDVEFGLAEPHDEPPTL